MINVFSKESLYEIGNKNKAYIIRNLYMTDVATLGFIEPINPETTKGTSYSCINCNYVILNGKLFLVNSSSLTQVGTLSNWTAVSGYSDSSAYAFGIAGGYLYVLSGSTATQVGTLNTWTAVSGYSTSSSTASSTYNALGIAGGKLYVLSGSKGTATQVGKVTNWSAISGYGSGGGNICAYGSAGHYIYYTDGLSTTTKVSGSYPSALTSIVSGYSNSSGSIYAYSIINGGLFILWASRITQVGTLNTWTAVSGYSSNGVYAYGIANGCLYMLNGSTATQVGTLNTWTAVSGYSSNGAYAYGIADGYLYRLEGSTVRQVYILNGSTATSQTGGASIVYGNSFVVCSA